MVLPLANIYREKERAALDLHSTIFAIASTPAHVHAYCIFSIKYMLIYCISSLFGPSKDGPGERETRISIFEIMNMYCCLC